MKTGKGFLIVLVNQKPPQTRQCTNLPTFLVLSSMRTWSCYEDGGAWAEGGFLSSLKDNILVKVTVTLVNISSNYDCIKISC